MPTSAFDPAVTALFTDLATRKTKTVTVDGKAVTIRTPFPSPEDWRDIWIYQLLTDRFYNPAAPPAGVWNGYNRQFLGGTFNGIRAKLPYLAQLGVGAIWISPVQKNCQYRGSYHGYGIQDFLSIDPRWCSDPVAAHANPKLVEDELTALIDEAHARNIYVIFDIVLHHTGDLFDYVLNDGTSSPVAPFIGTPYQVHWHDETGVGRADWPDVAQITPVTPDTGVWPQELRQNALFYRQGAGDGIVADFKNLKALAVSTDPVGRTLIRAYQYLVGRFDADGLRIDSFKYVDRNFGRIFCNAIREFAMSIGKENFLTFCEVFDAEDKIDMYVGRNTTDTDGIIGVDAALDFPLLFALPQVIKGFKSPSDLAGLYNYRQQAEREILSTHGDAGQYFVTFLDNHDLTSRVYYSVPPDLHRCDDQVTILLSCLFALQGIPCVYYGTEQGLSGSGDNEHVREALWGAPNPFDQTHPFYTHLKSLAAVRAATPAMRYGRQYFRQTSDGSGGMSISAAPGGIVAFSRVLNETEITLVANPNLSTAWSGNVVIDSAINLDGDKRRVLISNKPAPVQSITVSTLHDGMTRVLPLSLRAGEVQIIGL